MTDYDRSTTSYSGAMLIMQERRRQLDELSWTAEHDDQHHACELTMAAFCYAHHAVGQVNGICWDDEDDEWPSASWPWAVSWWKPSDDPVRNLVKAGALIAAEIDRLQRAASP